MNDKLMFFKTRGVKSPSRAHSTDAGIDFYMPIFSRKFLTDLKAIAKEPFRVEMNEFFSNIRIPKIILGGNSRILIPAGIKVIVPKDHCLIFFNKSGIASKKGLIVGSCVVDEHYSGEVHISLINTSSTAVQIIENEKIVQALVLPINYCTVVETTEDEYNELASHFTRGAKGFGSTDKK